MPATRSITILNILPGCGASPADSTIWAINSRLPGFRRAGHAGAAQGMAKGHPEATGRGARRFTGLAWGSARGRLWSNGLLQATGERSGLEVEQHNQHLHGAAVAGKRQ